MNVFKIFYMTKRLPAATAMLPDLAVRLSAQKRMKTGDFKKVYHKIWLDLLTVNQFHQSAAADLSAAQNGEKDYVSNVKRGTSFETLISEQCFGSLFGGHLTLSSILK